jgi:predicted RNA-binding Zn-ribbon protein involved in translation (DUF1610 family)
MSDLQNSTTCTDCGARLWPAATEAEGSVCPVCGSKRGTVQASARGGRLSHYALDNFVAHRLSELTECGPKPIEDAPNWIGAFVLNSIFVAPLEPKKRAYILNFLRRADGAISSYQVARIHLIEYLRAPGYAVSRHFRALLSFENCVAHLYQGMKLISAATKVPMFESGDGIKEERLNIIFNTSKHMDGRIEKGTMPEEATGAIWITNYGVECQQAKLSFLEIEELLAWVRDSARTLSEFKSS